ncbi:MULTISPECIES: nucleotide exchange factor GrpE [Kytococcus]|uniref:nucleotide exchange factor GrpE n=1 Tax=Kytococcus TaxID=57499 RepID=UPI0008A510B2|nr:MULTISPECIES: nucleotide exchange factor GrpE [Kytococcus]OFS11928.1 nucleotide exchange factor GrpE [Kytococcus sp. HMSC28H12]
MADQDKNPQNPDAPEHDGVSQPGSVEDAPTPQDAADAEQAVTEATAEPQGAATGEQDAADQLAEEADAPHPDTLLAAERLEDLRRAQADHVNYRNRMERERAKDKDATIGSVVEALIPVLDDVHMAREHGELEDGPMAAIATKLETTLERFGVRKLGEAGEEFDPNVHEALMHTEAELPEGTTATTVVQVMQPGFAVGERVVRAARVAVADPA